MNYQSLRTSDKLYPSQLRALLDDSPLYFLGNPALLAKPCAGLCGSRSASQAALTWSYEFGRQAAANDVVVVSGYARGVDRHAHKGALQSGGATIAVLPEGIDHFRMVSDLKSDADLESNFLAVSMFEPSDRWQVWRAMERNKLIVGLSSGLFVIEARQQGGTISAAYECMKQGKRLWAVAYDNDTPGRAGNRKLLASKAIPIEHLEDLGPALEDTIKSPPVAVKQLVMSVMNQTSEDPK